MQVSILCELNNVTESAVQSPFKARISTLAKSSPEWRFRSYTTSNLHKTTGSTCKQWNGRAKPGRADSEDDEKARAKAMVMTNITVMMALVTAMRSSALRYITT